MTNERNRNRVWVAAGIVVMTGALMALTALRPGDAPEPVKLVEIPTPPPPMTVVESLDSGETLADVLDEHGLTGAQILELVSAIREYESPRRLRTGTQIELAMRPDEAPRRISLRLDADRTLHLLASGSPADDWEARLDSVPVVQDTIVVAGVVGSNLYDARMSGDHARLSPGGLDRLAFNLLQIFQWEIDFWRDLRREDAFRVVIAREMRPDGTARSTRVLAAEFLNDGRPLTAILFHPDESEPVEYYDTEGEAMRGAFLFAPLDLARVTSGFNMRRFHPILRVRRPHLGIDYGAGRGTPVRATGSGVVSRAGPWGGYGNAIEIRHPNNLRTRYAHLSGIARGVRSGSRVEQGSIIGYVGSSGLATAAHLHYEFLRNGRQVNPARLNLPKAEPVPEERLDLFETTRDRMVALLERVRFPVPGFGVSARTQD